MATIHWKDIVAQKRKEQAASIPKDWILANLPSKDTLDVMDFPEKCGLLTAKEIEIANTEVDVLLEKLANGIWTSVEVTTAFSKRAIIAHQLVRESYLLFSLSDLWLSSFYISLIIGELPHRNIHRSGSSSCC